MADENTISNLIADFEELMRVKTLQEVRRGKRWHFFHFEFPIFVQGIARAVSGN